MKEIYRLLEQKHNSIIKFIKYVLTGGSAFLIEFAMFWFITVKFGIHPALSNAIVYTVTFWFVFIVNMYFTFGVKGKLLKRLIKYILLYLFNLCVTTGLMILLTAPLGIDKLVAKIIVSSLIVLWNFPLYRYVIYK